MQQEICDRGAADLGATIILSTVHHIRGYVAVNTPDIMHYNIIIVEF